MRTKKSFTGLQNGEAVPSDPGAYILEVPIREALMPTDLNGHDDSLNDNQK